MTVRVSSRRPVRARLTDEPPPGFDVERAELPATLARPDAGVRIAASRHGEELVASRVPDLATRVGEAGLTVAFGAPERGLPEVLDVPAGAERPTRNDEPSGRFDLWLNTVPDQGSEVVRTEEAIFATLASLTLPP